MPDLWLPIAHLASERADIELFGSENVSSSRRIVGLFEQAHKGTLYFDEICDLPLETQGKIVRAVTEQRFRRVGGNMEVSVDVRVISASSRDLAAEIAAGTVREDLYYRLGVVPLSIPPLSDRSEDVPSLHVILWIWSRAVRGCRGSSLETMFWQPCRAITGLEMCGRC